MKLTTTVTLLSVTDKQMGIDNEEMISTLNNPGQVFKEKRSVLVKLTMVIPTKEVRRT